MSADSVPFLQPGIAWALVVLFSVLWVALGIAWGRRGQGNADDYMLAGRNIGLALSTATLMASWVTGNTTLLAPEFGYKTGLWGMFSYALAGLGLILFAPLASRIKQLMPNGRTSGDFIRLRYGRLAWWVFMLITAIYTLGFLMTQAMGAGLLLQALSGFDYHVGMVVVIGVATVYTLFGGMRAVIGTDFIQSLLIMVLLAVVAVLAFRQFPMPEVHASLLARHPDRLDLLLPAGLLIAWNSALFSMGEVFHNNIWWSRVFASRRSVVMTSFVLGGIAWMSVPMVTGSIGLVALARELPLEQVNMVFPVMAADLLGAGGAASGVCGGVCLAHLHPRFAAGIHRRSVGGGCVLPPVAAPGQRPAAQAGGAADGGGIGRRHPGAVLAAAGFAGVGAVLHRCPGGLHGLACGLRFVLAHGQPHGCHCGHARRQRCGPARLCADRALLRCCVFGGRVGDCDADGQSVLAGTLRLHLVAGGGMIQTLPLMAGLVGLSGFQFLLVASQFALVLSVLVLLLIWWVEWRNGRVW